MLKDLFSSWFFRGALAVFLLIGAAGMLYMNNKAERAARDAVERAADTVKRYHEPKPADTATPDVGDTEPKVADTSQVEQWRDRIWNAAPPPVQQDAPSEKASPKPTRTAKKPFWEELGLEPPTGNWTYAWDGKGNYYKATLGQFTPFKIETKTGYAPTLEQFERRKRIHNEWHKAVNEGTLEEAERLLAEYDALTEASQGELPVISGGVYRGLPGESPEEARRKGRLLREETRRQLYREWGLEHLLTRR